MREGRFTKDPPPAFTIKKLKSGSPKWGSNSLSGHSFQMLKMTSSQHLYVACLQMFPQLFSESNPVVIHSRKCIFEGKCGYRILTLVRPDSFHRNLLKVLLCINSCTEHARPWGTGRMLKLL